MVGAVYSRALCLLVLVNCSRLGLGKGTQSTNKPKLSEEERQRLCHNFTVGHPDKQEFYSPFFPQSYPNDTDCILQITAPFGYYIQLDFRDLFALEESPTCDYDHLEIRDGPHGYSPLLTRVCGEHFPEMVSSSDRYLWLKFTSDDSIEDRGFRALYQFIKVPDFKRPPTDECITTVLDSSGLITPANISVERKDYSKKWNVSIDCTWAIHIPEGRKMYLNFQKYELFQPNNCELNFIDVYGESLSEDKMLARFCGTAAEPQKSDGRLMHVRFYARPNAINANFKIVFTTYREAEDCDRDEFDCDDGTCIDLSLKCDGFFNCKYRYDEERTLCNPVRTTSMVLTSEHMIIIQVVFFILVIAMCASIVISCWAKVKERKRRLREYRLKKSRFSIECMDREVAFEAAKIGARRGVTTIEDDDEGNTYIPGVYRSPNGGYPIHRIDEEGSSPLQLSVNSFLGEKHYCEKHGNSLMRAGSVSPPLPPPPPPPLHLKARNWEEDTYRTFITREEDEMEDERCIKAHHELELGSKAQSLVSTPDVIVHR